MELHQAIRRRAMVRSYSTDAVDPAIVDRIVHGALRAPTAGHTRGTAWVVLEGAAQTAKYWDATTDADWRADNSQWADGLRRAPVVLLAYASPDAYVARYGEPDKSDAGLGRDTDAWPIPYWYGDAAFGVMVALLAAVDAGLGACIVGTFRGEQELAQVLGVPEGWRLFCALTLGRPDGTQRRSPSLSRPGPAPAERIHRGRW